MCMETLTAFPGWVVRGKVPTPSDSARNDSFSDGPRLAPNRCHFVFNGGGLIGSNNVVCLFAGRHQVQRPIHKGNPLQAHRAATPTMSQASCCPFANPIDARSVKNWSATPARTENCEVNPDTQKEAIRGCAVSTSIHTSPKLCLL